MPSAFAPAVHGLQTHFKMGIDTSSLPGLVVFNLNCNIAVGVGVGVEVAVAVGVGSAQLHTPKGRRTGPGESLQLSDSLADDAV